MIKNKLSILINVIAIVLIIFSNSGYYTLGLSYYVAAFFYGIYAFSLIHSTFYPKIKDKFAIVSLDNLPHVLYLVIVFVQDKISENITVSDLNLLPAILFFYIIPVLAITGVSYAVSYFKFNPKKIMNNYSKYKFRIIFCAIFSIIFFY